MYGMGIAVDADTLVRAPWLFIHGDFAFKPTV
jgi:hypothetical protein